MNIKMPVRAVYPQRDGPIRAILRLDGNQGARKAGQRAMIAGYRGKGVETESKAVGRHCPVDISLTRLLPISRPPITRAKRARL